jgi:hypothetical protein
MISIRKYLDRTDKPHDSNQDSETSGLYSLYSALLDDLDQRILTKSRFHSLNARFAEIRAEVSPDLGEAEAAGLASRSSAVLADYEKALQQQATSAAIEMQHIVGMLNQALMVLAGGSERSLSRLKNIQTSLEKASYLQDIVALKSSLSDTMQFVREETIREQQSAAREKELFEKDLAKAKEFLELTRSGLLGREDGRRALAGILREIPSGMAVYAVAFVFERMQSVIQRYGPEVAEEMMMLLIKERLQALAPDVPAYRWNPSSVVAFVVTEPDLAGLRARAEALNRAQLVHRAAVGSRTAVLTLKPSCLVIEAAGRPDVLVEELDRFTGLQF